VKLVGRLTRVVVALALVVLAADAAQATTETIKRATSNLLFGPLDTALSPVVAAKAEYQNWNQISDSDLVKIVYPIPGFFWLTGVQLFTGVIRTITGAIELVPGLFLLPLDTDLPLLFDPADRNPALIEYDNAVLPVKIGVDYTSTPY
jgi:hypothetical protein